MSSPARRVALAAVLFAAAGVVGRATIIDGQSLSLIWPAAGIAALWVGSARTRSALALDLLVLAAITFAVNRATGAATPLALLLVATNVLQVLTFVRLVRHWIPGLWGFGGSRPLTRLADMGRLTAAALLACLLGAMLGALGLQVITGSADPTVFAVWWGRNTIAVIVLVTFVVQIGQPLSAAEDPRRLLREAFTPASPVRLLEAVGLVTGSALVFDLVFDQTGSGRPLAFLALVASVWAGLRFAPVAVTAHGLGMGIAGVVFTLHGLGPFAAIDSLHYRALVAQLFVAMAVLTGLALAFSRAERDHVAGELRAARRAADDRARLLDAVLESMNEGIAVLDHDGTVLVRNRAARELAELIGEVHETVQPAATYGIFHANGVPFSDDELAGPRALAGEVVPPTEVHLRLPGSGRILEVAAQPLSGEEGDQRRALVNTRDVTAAAQHRDALASFAGVIAHDLFNPLSVVDGWTEALGAEFAAGPVSPTVGTALVDRIHDAAARMRTLIADLLAYTVARDQSLRLGPVDLGEVVQEISGMRMPLGAEPLVVVAPGLRVWADAGLVRQLMDNLIGNAVKYVAPGVRPRVAVEGTADGDWLEVRVSDNGIGIPDDQHDLIFETFHRAHAQDFRGTGLGLAICRRIVDRHGGTITAAADPGGIGSVFTFRLPVAADVPATAGRS